MMMVNEVKYVLLEAEQFGLLFHHGTNVEVRYQIRVRVLLEAE